MKKLIYLGLLLTSCSIQIPEIRDSVSLEGEWGFRIDSLDVGIREQWYNQSLDGQATLPGSMTENGLGDEVTLATPWTGSVIDSSYFTDVRYEKYRNPDNLKIPFWLKPVKYYTGPAWYQREVTIPGTWEGHRVILHLERCHWESTVFINDTRAGRENSLSVPHQYDITSLLQKGENRISIRIDNRMIVPVGINSHSVSDHTQSNWNGIIGEIRLENRGTIQMERVQIYPDIHAHYARVAITIRNKSGDPFQGKLQLQARSFNSEKSHSPARFSKHISVPGEEQVVELVYPMGEESLLWSEFSPSLYHLEVELADEGGNAVDGLREAFGMREFKAVGTRFAVNGRPLFLRGTLECCIFPLTGYPPTDEASWMYLFDRCKVHGLNHLRFHSWCPPKAAFQAADKQGFYLQVECASWANNWGGMGVGDGTPVDSFIYREGDRILETYGNHPSFCMLAYGNEPGGKNQTEYLGELLEYWKSKDPRRVYTSAAGWPFIPENQYHNDPGPRIQHWGEGLGSVINSAPPQTSYDFHNVLAQYDVPVVSHEIGQWCVYPDFKEIAKYTGILKPTNFEIFKETLEENHMGHQSEDFLMASGKLQALCYKADIEAALRTPGFAGFQLLQLHDFPGQGTALVGILDPFFNSKGYIDEETFRRFCNRTVPLARMEKRVFTSGETFKATVELAHFGETPLTGQRIRCQIRDGAKNVLFEQLVEKEVVPIDNAIPAGSIQYELGELSEAGKLTFEVSLDGTPYANSWDFWVYPETANPDPGEVKITEKLDTEALKALQEGGSVLLLTHGHVNKDHGGQVQIGFSSIFWNTAWTGGQAPHTLGILCDPDHPVFDHFPTEFHSNWQWWDPITRSQAMILDHLPGELQPLVQPIDTWFENRKLGLLFEAKVGAGHLMVCSIDFMKDLKTRPVSRQLLVSILVYMNSPAFHPVVELDPDEIRVILNPGPETGSHL
jgi:hypothetical protein